MTQAIKSLRLVICFGLLLGLFSYTAAHRRNGTAVDGSSSDEATAPGNGFPFSNGGRNGQRGRNRGGFGGNIGQGQFGGNQGQGFGSRIGGFGDGVGGRGGAGGFEQGGFGGGRARGGAGSFEQGGFGAQQSGFGGNQGGFARQGSGFGSPRQGFNLRRDFPAEFNNQQSTAFYPNSLHSTMDLLVRSKRNARYHESASEAPTPSPAEVAVLANLSTTAWSAFNTLVESMNPAQKLQALGKFMRAQQSGESMNALLADFNSWAANQSTTVAQNPNSFLTSVQQLIAEEVIVHDGIAAAANLSDAARELDKQLMGVLTNADLNSTQECQALKALLTPQGNASDSGNNREVRAELEAVFGPLPRARDCTAGPRSGRRGGRPPPRRGFHPAMLGGAGPFGGGGGGGFFNQRGSRGQFRNGNQGFGAGGEAGFNGQLAGNSRGGGRGGNGRRAGANGGGFNGGGSEEFLGRNGFNGGGGRPF